MPGGVDAQWGSRETKGRGWVSISMGTTLPPLNGTFEHPGIGAYNYRFKSPTSWLYAISWRFDRLRRSQHDR
jgi:hypothetical protein